MSTGIKTVVKADKQRTSNKVQSSRIKTGSDNTSRSNDMMKWSAHILNTSGWCTYVRNEAVTIQDSWTSKLVNKRRQTFYNGKHVSVN